jgi:Flp pilus assembly protein TadG
MLRLLRSFRQRADGNVAVIFALAVLPILCLAGAALDYSRAASLNSKVQADIDATTLALCKSTVTSTSALTSTAQTMLNAYSPTAPVTVDTLSVTSGPRTVTLSGHLTYTAAFTQLMGIPTINVAANASCSAGETFYEIALVVDTTGSMANSAGGVSKIQALRTSATNFVNTMFGSIDSAHLKISLVPFAASVKVDPVTYANASWLDLNGKSSLHWQNISSTGTNGAAASNLKSRFDVYKKLAAVNSSWAWEGCLESLPYPLNVTDVAPAVSNLDSYYVPTLAPDEVGNITDFSYPQPNNSYMDDGSASSGLCDNNVSSQSTRMIQGCKYASPRNIRTSQPGPGWMCDARALTRLTNTKATLLSEISQLQAAGNTDIHEGLMWGWRTISPNSVFADGAPYKSATVNTVKIIVLMTDGTNTWTDSNSNVVNGSYYSAYGYFNNADGSTPKSPTSRFPASVVAPSTSANARTAIDTLTNEACTNVKAAGVTVYTVGFCVSSDPIDSAGQTLLQNCATQTSNYFLASDSTALNTAFGSIAQGIGQLRLTK